MTWPAQMPTRESQRERNVVRMQKKYNLRTKMTWTTIDRAVIPVHEWKGVKKRVFMAFSRVY